MSLFNLPLVNTQLKHLRESDFPDTRGWCQTREIIRSQVDACPPAYTINEALRSVLFGAVVALAGTFFVLLLYTLLQAATFSGSAIILAVTIPSLMLTGGGIVLYRVSQKIDIFAGKSLNLFVKRRWVPVPLYNYESGKWVPVRASYYLDTSTLEQGSGIGLAYFFPHRIGSRAPMFVLPLVLSFFLVTVRVVYNILRFLVIPFYILFQIVHRTPQVIEEEESFVWKDIFREMGRSLYNCLRAPFYGIAYVMTLFYGLLDPLAGRVATACVERDWNDDIIRSRSIWLCWVQRNFMFEGNGWRTGLGQFGYYSMGCFQPCALFLCKNGAIVSGTRPSAVHYTGLVEYTTTRFVGY